MLAFDSFLPVCAVHAEATISRATDGFEAPVRSNAEQ
jgi:hypothetical protein